MADLQEVFRILRDDTTGAGEAPISRIEGEAALTKEGLIGFSFKDNANNVILPKLDSDGRVRVSFEGAGIEYYEYAEVAAGSLALVDVAVATIALSKTYIQMNAQGCCLRSSLFQVVYRDDAAGTPVDTVLDEFIVGPGQYSYNLELKHNELNTAAGTGVQELVLKAKNFAYASSLRGYISAIERV